MSDVMADNLSINTPTLDTQDKSVTKFETPGQIAWRRFRQHKVAVVGSVVLIGIAILCFGAPLFTD
jgi:ABC-type antimicrobial peptide transport system permease subunit